MKFIVWFLKICGFDDFEGKSFTHLGKMVKIFLNAVLSFQSQLIGCIILGIKTKKSCL